MKSPKIEWLGRSTWTDFILGEPSDPTHALNRERFLSDLNEFRDLPQRTLKGRRGGLGFIPPTVVTNAEYVLLPRVGAPAAISVDLSKPTVVLMNGQLRLYVDEWLATGRTKEGVEDPRERDLTKAPIACWAIRNFAMKERFELEPVRHGLRLRLPGSWPSDPLQSANRLFALLFLCDWRLKIAKCRRDGCGCYFELNHWNRVYKRGTFCPECVRARSLDSAIVHTAKARREAELELYRLAAQRFSKRIAKNPNWHGDRKLKETIAGFLNAQIEHRQDLRAVYRSGGRQGVSLKWLGWAKHRSGIENAVREVAHAKG